MKNKQKYLAKNIFLFLASSFIPKILTIVLIPLYTNYLTTAEYAVSDIINTTVSLLIPLFTLDIQDAVIRFALDKNYDKTSVFSMASIIVRIGTIIICIASFTVFFFNIKGLEDFYLIFFVVMFFTTATYNMISLFCRGIEKVNVMVGASIINTIIALLLNILLLTRFRLGLVGFLIANASGSMAAILWCFFGAKLYKFLKIRLDKKLCKEMIVFSAPLIFSVIAWWINSASDRYILTWMSRLAASGIYAISYKIPNILSLFQNVFSQAWSISAIKEFDKNDSDGFISNVYNMLNFCMIGLCSIVMIFNIPIAKLLYAEAFFEAWKYVPPLLISVVFNALALFIGSIFTAVKDTKTLSWSTIVGAAVNTLCNFVLIYYFQAYGASIATLIGYLTILIIRHIVLRKHITLHINWKRDIFSYIILIGQMIMCTFGLKLILLQIFILICLMLLYKKEIRTIFKEIKTTLDKMRCK